MIVNGFTRKEKEILYAEWPKDAEKDRRDKIAEVGILG
jgi:hypothetical protein